MEDNNVSLETCLEKLNFNKKHYGQKGLDMQIYFVGQLFNMNYNQVINAMNEHSSKQEINQT